MPPGQQVVLGADVWLKILCFCSAADIVEMSKTCIALAAICENPQIWYHALIQISYAKRLPNLFFRIQSMSARVLKEKALTSVHLDEIWGHRSIKPMKTYQLGVANVRNVLILPGGDWIFLLGSNRSAGELQLFEADIEKPDRRFRFVESEWAWTDARLFVSSRHDNLVLVRSYVSQAEVLGVYHMVTENRLPSIELKLTMTLQPQPNGCTAMGDYIAYGWIESSGEPSIERHFVRIMKLDSDYRSVVEQSTMEVQLKSGQQKHHSYAMRLSTSASPRIIVAGTAQIALYDVPEFLPPSEVSERVLVSPVWQFDCSRMSPRAVHLVPDGPIIILYADRCLIIEPYFDLESPHPTYVGTYTVPLSLERLLILGPHRAFWDRGQGRLASCALPTPCQPYDEDEVISGYFKVEGQIQTQRVVLPLAWDSSDDDGGVIRMAWDEESGRLCVLVKGEKECQMGVSLIISDMYHPSSMNDLYSDTA
ncbi:hypothetical protein BJ138DRAFT_1118699 [Hygrophoropsis aurantiaca]|uniref:Uncharacterized protein n=1 Tax=Hygrophoropsis aurantiaca TaxID=72124 RepID=A0ACB7ZVI4_9AGAM|nr:hypothetical protein BJ138DRAFT_1118699 [Hygrophoropsis aurantiaca]